MGALVMGWLLSLLGGSFLDRILGHLERKANTDTERLRITALREKSANAESAGVIKEGMQHKAFWIPWLLASVPLSAWFAWGVMDSTFNGALPDVATLPPQLKEYADIVWSNIFYVGGGVAGAGIIANAIKGKR
jgi:hypothetical protein